MKPLRLLLVDDDFALLLTLAEYLRNTLSAIVVTATSVPAALAQIDARGPFDVLISDFDLPPHTAHDLEEHLRNALVFTPMLIHSGYPKIEESRFHPASYLGLVVKPGTRELVTKILETFPQAKKS